MIDYVIYLNNGNEYLGIDKKTITVGEKVRNVESSDLAEEITHINPLIAEMSADTVLESYIPAVGKLLGMGFAVQFRNKKGDVVMRISPDLEITGGSIDLERAKILDPSTTDLTKENAAELVKRAGITMRVKVETFPKFAELLRDRVYKLDSIVERAKILKSNNTTIDTSTNSEPAIDPSTNNQPGGMD